MQMSGALTPKWQLRRSKAFCAPLKCGKQTKYCACHGCRAANCVLPVWMLQSINGYWAWIKQFRRTRSCDVPSLLRSGVLSKWGQPAEGMRHIFSLGRWKQFTARPNNVAVVGIGITFRVLLTTLSSHVFLQLCHPRRSVKNRRRRTRWFSSYPLYYCHSFYRPKCKKKRKKIDWK